MHVAYSERIAGVGLFSGGGYSSLTSYSDLVNIQVSDRVRDTTDFDSYFAKAETMASADGMISFANNAES